MVSDIQDEVTSGKRTGTSILSKFAISSWGIKFIFTYIQSLMLRLSSLSAPSPVQAFHCVASFQAALK